MKKLLKISALALTMTALLFSCANPSGESSSSDNSNSSSIGADLPTVKEVSKPTEVKPEDMAELPGAPKFTSGKKSVETQDDYSKVHNTLFSHLEDTFYYAGTNLSKNEAFRADVLSKVMNENEEILPKFKIDVSNKKYDATGVSLDIKTGKVELDLTSETSGKILAEIEGSAVLNGDIKKVRKMGDKGPILKDDGTPEMEQNSIKYLVANLNTNDAVATNETAVAGDISAAISGLLAFDDANGYSGYISLNGNVNIKDLAALADTLSKNESAQKIMNYTEGAPEPTSEDYKNFADLLDSYDKATVDITAQFLDTEGKATGMKFEIKKLSQLYGLY